MNKVHLRNIFLKGTTSGPSFKNVNDLKVENMTFIGGKFEGRALDVDGGTSLNLEQALNYIKNNLSEIPEAERKKILNILENFESTINESSSDEARRNYIAFALRTIYDISVAAGGSLIPQFLAPFLN